jgi:hypothetical protein
MAFLAFKATALALLTSVTAFFLVLVTGGFLEAICFFLSSLDGVVLALLLVLVA